MKKKYCVDTSGFSTPHEQLPYDLYGSIWDGVMRVIRSGCIAVTTEIYKEMRSIPDEIGECIWEYEEFMVLEVGSPSWDWQRYVGINTELLEKHKGVISEYTTGSPKTICVNDMSIIALAKSLGLPVVSSESYVRAKDAKKQHIPNICEKEEVEHLTFNEFLRREGIKAS
jgi:hypothetical protein